MTSDLIKMKLHVSSLVENLNDNTNISMGGKNLTLYVDEEVTSFECVVPKLLFHKEGLVIRLYRKDGTTIKLGEVKGQISNFQRFKVHAPILK